MRVRAPHRPALRAAAVLALSGVLAAGAACGDDGDRAVGEAGQVATDPPVPVGREVAPRPSAGCGTSTVGPGQERVTLWSAGAERWYLRHVPAAHDGADPVPVVIDLHGYSEGADVHADATQLGTFGGSRGFVTVTPHGQGEVPRWDVEPGSRDVVFLVDLLDAVEEELCVDTARVYATGLSNGAMMTSGLACGLADRIAAAAPVAGVAEVPDCDPGRPVPVVAFHGTDDSFLRYEGGFGPGVQNLPAPGGDGTLGDSLDSQGSEPDQRERMERALTPVPEVMAHWAERNGCTGGPHEEPAAEDVGLLTWDCPPGGDVQLYRVDGGGHTWPGSEFLAGLEEIVGHTTTSISANEVMWAFFQEQALPA